MDLLAIDYPLALALRSVLEYVEVRVNLHTIGRAAHVVAAMNGKAPHLVVACHGDDAGIILPEVSRSAVPDEPFYDRLTPQDVLRHGQLNSRVVIVTGCGTGRDQFADAFIKAGATVFIGPTGYPEDVLFFLVHLYYGLRLGKDLADAFKWTRNHEVPDSELFRFVASSAS